VRVVDLLDQFGGAEDECHRGRLERGLTTEQVGDGTASFSVAGGHGVGVEARERADRDRAGIERLGVGFDLLERGELADLDVAIARLVPWELRTSWVWGDGDGWPPDDGWVSVDVSGDVPTNLVDQMPLHTYRT
jgi:hypothetical protein